MTYDHRDEIFNYEDIDIFLQLLAKTHKEISITTMGLYRRVDSTDKFNNTHTLLVRILIPPREKGDQKLYRDVAFEDVPSHNEEILAEKIFSVRGNVDTIPLNKCNRGEEVVQRFDSPNISKNKERKQRKYSKSTAEKCN